MINYSVCSKDRKKKNKENLSFKQDYEFLIDKPIPSEEDQNIRFGHKEIARTLSDLILKAKPPFTIALFGKWGTGKSTISNSVKKHIEDQGIKIYYAQIEWFAKDLIKIDQETQKRVNVIFAELDDNPDINDYYTNIE